MPTNPKIKLGWTYPQRRRLLEELDKSSKGKYTHQLKFQGKMDSYQVYSVEIDLPKYRLTNGRTQASQEMYLAKHPHLELDFFTKDWEAEQAQDVQHGLLWELVEKTPLLDYFKNPSNSQDQPLILDHKGFVVNGNRRLCAMRELYYGDQEKYNHFGHIDIVVLPPCSDRDIDELEAYLQIQPDIKLDYSWIAMACMLRARQEKYRYTEEQLATIYGISQKEIQASSMELALVDDYLTSRGKAKQYDEVGTDKYAFEQLHKGRQKIKQHGQRDVFTQLSYCLIESGGDEVEGRLYQRIPEVRENLPKIIEDLQEELASELTEFQSTNEYDLLGAESDTDQLQSLAGTVMKSEYRSRVLDTVLNVIDSQKELARRYKRENVVLRQLVDANTRLRNAINSITEGTAKRGVEEQLQAIESSIIEIRKWLNNDA